MPDQSGDLKKYIDLAESLGADRAMAISPDDIVFDSRTLLKCMFGCEDWGKGHTCPSRAGSLKPWEYEPILRRYAHVIVIHAHDKQTAQTASYAVERAAFLDGDAFAFSMSDCALCSHCTGHHGAGCTHPTQARPAFHSVGIDVFATARSLRLPIRVLKDADQQQNWYAAVWLGTRQTTQD